MNDIIGFTGFKGAGKDSAAKALISAGYENVKFAGALKAMFRALLHYVGTPSGVAEDMIEGSLKEAPCQLLCGKTPREFMQLLGTEFGRNLIGEDFWVRAAMQRASGFDRVVITDVRFPNEASAIFEADGEVYHVRGQDVANEFSAHASEQYIDDLEVTGYIHNDGTLEDLNEEIRLRFLVSPENDEKG